jgi:hypothetical protein
LEGKTNDVKIREGSVVLEGNERQLTCPQFLCQIDPRRVAPFGECSRIFIEESIQDPITEVAHPDVVYVGKREADPSGDGIPILEVNAMLASGVARRFLDAIQEF